MFTIAIVNEKGGTGKTSTAVNLAAALGEIGRKTLLVDLDGQAASSRWLGVEEDSRLADEMLEGGRIEPIEEVLPGVSLAPGSGKLDSVAHDLRPTQGGQLRKVLSQLDGRYEYVLIDCPPSLGNRLIGNALLAASHAIVPVEPSILSLDGLQILMTTLADVRDGFEHPIKLIGVVACRYERRTRLSRLVLAELNRALPGRVFKTVIHETVRMQECPASGKSILEYAPSSSAAGDYRALARELVAGGPAAAAADQITEGDLIREGALDSEDRDSVVRFRQWAAQTFGGEDKVSAEGTKASSPSSTEQETLVDESLPREAAGEELDSSEPVAQPARGAAGEVNWASLGKIAEEAENEIAAEEETVTAAAPYGSEEPEEQEPALAGKERAKRVRLSRVLVGTAGAMILIASFFVTRWVLTGGKSGPRATEAAEGKPPAAVVVPKAVQPAAAERLTDAGRQAPAQRAAVTSEQDVQAEAGAAEDTSPPEEELVEPPQEITSSSVESPADQPTEALAGVREAEQDEAAPAETEDEGDSAEESSEGESTSAAAQQPGRIVTPPGFTCSAVVQSPSGKLAVINGQIVGVGDKIDEAVLVGVHSWAVELEINGKRFTLGVGEAQGQANQPAATADEQGPEAQQESSDETPAD
ncbi:MAG: ParA family protein [Planctomycetota bacterium]|jgi:chromosome partitioning protein